MMRLPSFPRRFWAFLAATLLLICLLNDPVQGFVAPQVQQNTFFGINIISSSHASAILQSKQDDDDEEEDDWMAADSVMLPEKSQMYGFISDYLKRENNEEDEEATEPKFSHLIAVPMADCHELGIELESVQRAILYHCPVLVHTCLVPAITRLPLLYVEAPSSSKEATDSLHRIVQEVVQKHIFVPSSSTTTNDGDDIPLDGDNTEGVRPLTLTFQSLEIDGRQNEALHTVALSDDPGTARLQNLVAELQTTIASRLQWETCLPPDDHIVNKNNNEPPVFRPRVPFMRIPSNFQEFLEPLEDGREESWRTPDEGGNGISPIFWSNWWDDVFGMARLREIGIYPRSSTQGGLAEDAFHLPLHLTALPDGNKALTMEEAKFEAYQEQRMKQAEYDRNQDREKQRGLFESRNSQDDRMMEKTRERLETLYQTDIQEANEALVNQDETFEETFQEDPDRPKVDTTLLDEWTRERIKKANAANGITMYDEDDDDEEESSDDDQEVEDAITQVTEEDNTSPPPSTEESTSSNDTVQTTSFEDANDELDDWTRERMRKIVDSREVVKAKERERLKSTKKLVPIEDNPVFKAYREGKPLPGAPQEQANSSDDNLPPLPPFPARENFVGFWKVMNSPTGFPPDDEGDASKSENLILRVDGTTAGGPILDPETLQKAAGGTWKITPDEEDEDVADLRIRLVIPPKKERILVMQGTATKGPLTSSLTSPTTSSTFGIPELEERVKKAREAEQKEFNDGSLDDDIIRCKGKVWLEDAITGKNKVEIGQFSIQKLNTPRDPKKLTITIPRPIRNQD